LFGRRQDLPIVRSGGIEADGAEAGDAKPGKRRRPVPIRKLPGSRRQRFAGCGGWERYRLYQLITDREPTDCLGSAKLDASEATTLICLGWSPPDCRV
jgi:hypothetical protein